MFRAFRKRAIEAFLRRSMSVSEGTARRKDNGGVPHSPGAPAMPRLSVPTVTSASGQLEVAGRIPPQAHRAPYLEDIDDWS